MPGGQGGAVMVLVLLVGWCPVSDCVLRLPPSPWSTPTPPNCSPTPLSSLTHLPHPLTHSLSLHCLPSLVAIIALPPPLSLHTHSPSKLTASAIIVPSVSPQLSYGLLCCALLGTVQLWATGVGASVTLCET